MSPSLLMNRRGLVRAGAASLAAAVVTDVTRPATAATLDAQAADGALPRAERFRFGNATVTVVSDGMIITGDPKKSFRGAPAEQIGAVLADSFQETDRLVFDENVTVVQVGGQTILFDTGCGPITAFGPHAGRLPGNLSAAGFEPSTIDAVVLTHGHADHIGGLVADGRLVFSNARYFIGAIDHAFWRDPAQASPPLTFFHQEAVTFLTPIRERLTLILDGQEFLPGVQAHLAPGHTPGHMIFTVSSGGRSIAILADLARHFILNVETPRLEFVGDIDPRLAVETRLRVFDMLVHDRTALLSYHFPFPGVGHLAKKAGGYRFYPANLQSGI